MDQIKSLLEATGLSPDDLIKKLAEYKAQSVFTPSRNESPPSTAEVIQKASSKSNYEQCNGLLNGNATTTHKPRLKITELISNKLQNMQAETTNGEKDVEDDEKNAYKSESTKLGEKRKPIYGYLRKNLDKKRARMTKPPWLIDKSDNTECTSSDNIENAASSSNSTQESSLSAEAEIINKDDDDDTRMKIFNQLQQLRCRKDISPLVPIKEHALKRFVKRNTKHCETSNVFNIKIVDVQSGVNLSKMDNIHIKTEKSDDFEIINEHLDCNTIELSKTKDYKKIKGWRGKKILYKLEMNTAGSTKEDVLLDVNKCKEELAQPSCSYKIPKIAPVDYEAASTSSKLPKIEVEEPNIFESKQLDTFLDNPVEKPIGEEEIKSEHANVFASNNLDGFLNQQKDLNISYDIPNLESSNVKLDPCDSKVLIQDNEVEVKADNKRLFSIAEDEGATSLNQNLKSHPNKPRTLAEKRKLLERTRARTEASPKYVAKSIGKSVEKSVEIPKGAVYSYVFYKGGKVKVLCRYFKNVYLNRKIKKKGYEYVSSKKRPSIYCTQSHQNISYRPGPMLLKPQLQFTLGNWHSFVKKLPQVYVNVTPALRKQVHPSIRRFLYCNDNEITAERADFALTALNCTNSNSNEAKKTFRFDVPYKHGQKYIVVTKEVEEQPVNVIGLPKTESDSDVESVVSNVMEKMLSYVETKQIADDIIKDDPDLDAPIVNNDTASSSKKANKAKSQAIKGASKRTSLELKRLSVKVIEVDIGDDEESNNTCTKDYCKFGCVCKSIKSNPLPADHCSEAKCIFKCICGFEQLTKNNIKFNVPAGTELLSDRTVNRLQQEAKKDLAKVEKEFTQTVIKAKNQTIVVGDNLDNRRRSAKCPKKFEDYCQTPFLDDDENDDFIKVKPISPKRAKPEPQVNDFKLLNCTVNSLQCDFNHIIPYCFVHNWYDCYCNFEAEYTKPSDDEMISVKALASTPKTQPLEILSPLKLNSEVKETPSCARTKVIPPVNQMRRKTPQPKKSVKLTPKPKEIVIQHDDATKTMRSPPLLQDDTFDDPLLAPMAVENVDSSSPSKQNRRKQMLKTREEVPVEPALQRRRSKSTKRPEPPSLHAQMKDLRTFTSDFQSNGIWYAPNKEVTTKFAKFLGVKNNLSDFRLLQWSALMKKYMTRQIEIWMMHKDLRYNFLITCGGTSTLNGYKNIRNLEYLTTKNKIKNDLLRCILTRACPSNERTADDVLVILKTANIFWEIHGLCSKKSDAKDIDETSKKTKELVNAANNKYKTVQHVPYTNGKFITKMLKLNSPSDTDNAIESLEAPLPNIQDIYRWRMLEVNSNFSVLALKRNDFRIKCSDLVTVIKFAEKYSRTIIINSLNVTKNYNHEHFGIYLVPNYTNRIFIGPYLLDEDHDIETLRFVNNVLVHTDVFNKMKGKGETSTTGCWYHQVGKTVQNSSPINSVIDLTEVDEKEKVDAEVTPKVEAPVETCSKVKLENTDLVLNKNKMVSILKLNVTKEDKSLTKKEISIDALFTIRLTTLMKNLKLTVPEKATPIAFKVNFDAGLIFGYQGKQIGLYSPANYVCRTFSTVDTAIDWLRHEFKANFLIVPNTYNIEISLIEKAEYLEALVKTAMKEEYFSEIHMIGEYGCLNVMEMVKFAMKHPGMLIKKLGMGSKEKTFVNAIKRYVGKEKTTSMDFINKCIIELKHQIIYQDQHVSKFSTVKTRLEKRQILLLSVREKLLKKADEFLRAQLTEEFRAKWTPNKEFVEPVVVKTDVICLDSDEEDSKKDDNESNDIETKPIINGNGHDFTILPTISTIKSPPSANATNKRCPLSSLKRRSSTEIIPLPLKTSKTIERKQSTELQQSDKPAEAQNGKAVEFIDLSHLTSAALQAILGTNLSSTQLKLSRTQLDDLKALSLKNKITITTAQKKSSEILNS